MLTDAEIGFLAAQVLDVSCRAASMPPLTDLYPLDLADGYRVSALVTARRIARGERPVGWKIGFTNRTIWDEYGVHAPIWGPVYDTTLRRTETASLPFACELSGFVEPRIEPEIVLRIARSPSPDMDEAGLLACLDGVAHGFEIVQSLYPAWRFRAPDTVAAFGLHACLNCGPFAMADAADWRQALTNFSITLLRDGREIDRGIATHVLGGPLSALKHFVQGLADHNPFGRGLEPGDVVTTGTVTRAFPVKPGETWSTRIEGLPLEGLSIAFA